jgi:mono/diheme cytochrome c family protein
VAAWTRGHEAEIVLFSPYGVLITLKLIHKSLLVLMGLSLIICLGGWRGARAAGSAPGELNWESGLTVASSPQAQIDTQDASPGRLAQMGGGMGGGMMGGQGYQRGQGYQQQYQERTGGVGLFAANCASCHPNGGNIIVPNLPVRGAPQLGSYSSFRDLVRQGRGPMPPFPSSRISDSQLRELYRYVRSVYGG